jgi:predicted TIM-barrel fold metal-dependent hydrolase
MLPLWHNQYYLQPYPMLHRLGQTLLFVGADKLCYGSEGFLWPHMQTYIDTWANLEMPEELQDKYGYPELTPDIKEQVFGLNFARGLGIDLEVKKNELGLL